MNNEVKYISLKNANSLSPFPQETFLTSCFVFYYGKIKVHVPFENREKTKDLRLTRHFLETKKYKRTIVIDYANVIYVLHDRYHDKETVAMKFCRFLLKNLRQNNKIIIVTKPVFIKGENYSIQEILSIGQKEGKIEKAYFASEQLCIYLLNLFSPKSQSRTSSPISSSIDDLLQWFILFVVFVYYKKNRIRILGKKSTENKITLLTNDSQFFDKNLFGKTEDEKANHIDYLRNLRVQHVEMREGEYVAVFNPLEQAIVADFLRNYVVEDIHNTSALECNLSIFLELLLNEKTPRGFFKKNTQRSRHSKFQYNENFTRKNITKHDVKKYDYETANSIFANQKNRKTLKKCKKQVILRPNHLKKSYYLYAFIKYIQMYLNTTDTDQKYGNFYGNYSKEDIVDMIE
jgi:hypothetical protein